MAMKFAERLQSLGFASYAEYLASDRWKAKRREYRASGLPQGCMGCDEGPVHLHHRTYDRLGEERLTDLVPLCKSCHTKVHEYSRRKGKDLRKTSSILQELHGWSDAERSWRFKAHDAKSPASRESKAAKRKKRKEKRKEKRKAKARAKKATTTTGKVLVPVQPRPSRPEGPFKARQEIQRLRDEAAKREQKVSDAKGAKYEVELAKARVILENPAFNGPLRVRRATEAIARIMRAISSTSGNGPSECHESTPSP